MALVNETGRILQNRQVGSNLYVMEVTAPQIAAGILPGQFVHMKLPGMEGHILRRPFSVYAVGGEGSTLEILYQTVGFGTDHLATLGEGAVVETIGPVGHGWNLPEGCKKALLVAGGVGAAPLFMLAQSICESGIELDVVLGAQTEAALVCRERYEALGAKSVSCSTDDGSFGRAGFCTSLVEEALESSSYDYVACCGPEPLMKIVAGMAGKTEAVCEVSLERRMACGVGACLSCVVDTVDGKKRSCVDGPVFNREQVMW